MTMKMMAVWAMVLLQVVATIAVATKGTAGVREGDGAHEKVCIVGSGIGGASAAYFLQKYSENETPLDIEIYEKHGKVGGRLARVQLGEDEFESGGSIIADRNRHMHQFVKLLNLTPNSDFGQESFGIWDGEEIFFQTLQAGESSISQKVTSIWNTVRLLWRYGASLLKMNSYISELLGKWDVFYYDDEEGEQLPTFDTVEAMLKFVGLYERTQKTLQQDLLARGFSSRLIDELITVIVRINYGQNVSISGLAGAVALAGSGDDLWNVKEGNWKVPEGLIEFTNASLHLNEEVLNVTYKNGGYELSLSSRAGQTTATTTATTATTSSFCDAVIIATPLDEEGISFKPGIEIPERSLQHTYTTFVLGLIECKYFGAASAADLPPLISTIEDPRLEFSSISILKSYSDVQKAYKVFSRAPLMDADLDRLFSIRIQTIRIDWGAYPHYTAPEQFAPVVLDGNHLYYINSFESAASAMEASAVAARNVARLLLLRMSGSGVSNLAQVVLAQSNDTEGAAEL